MKAIRSLQNRIITRSAIAFFAACVIATPLAAQDALVKLEAVASYYGDEFQGRPTSSGEVFDMNAYTCAHKTLPFGTMLEVTNLANGRKSVVRVNDRGPFVEGREIDVSKAAAYDLGMVSTGTARVSIRKVGMDGTAAPTSAAPATASSAPAVASVAPVASTATAAPADTQARALKGNANAPGTEARWRIQLGSFSKPENANRLVIQLRKDGFNPAIERTESMTRVVLAGIPDSALGSMKDRLAAAGYANGLVRGE